MLSSSHSPSEVRTACDSTCDCFPDVCIGCLRPLMLSSSHSPSEVRTACDSACDCFPDVCIECLRPHVCLSSPSTSPPRDLFSPPRLLWRSRRTVVYLPPGASLAIMPFDRRNDNNVYRRQRHRCKSKGMVRHGANLLHRSGAAVSACCDNAIDYSA